LSVRIHAVRFRNLVDGYAARTKRMGHGRSAVVL
jgi:hypothetical protein